MIGRLASITLAGFAIGCAAPRPENTPSARDSVRGIVSITGTSFQKTIMLRTTAGSVGLSAAAADSVSLSRLGGIEVLVEGSRTAAHFRVERFKAVTVEGRPVLDGIIRVEGAQLFLDHDGKRTLIGNPPTVLCSMPGARVWIEGSLTTGPNTFGIIRPPDTLH